MGVNGRRSGRWTGCVLHLTVSGSGSELALGLLGRGLDWDWDLWDLLGLGLAALDWAWQRERVTGSDYWPTR